jgi:hypothetical protein
MNLKTKMNYTQITKKKLDELSSGDEGLLSYV